VYPGATEDDHPGFRKRNQDLIKIFFCSNIPRKNYPGDKVRTVENI
jgi:hypothetical protein